MINHDAIFALYPNVVTISHITAYDKDGNIVEYDVDAVNAKSDEMQAQEQANIKAKAEAKASAIAKLAALGLTEEEIKHIL